MPTIPQTDGSLLGTSGTKSVKNPALMGKEDFLQLLVAQLKNQDPSNTQDMESMTQQMTQFSILEQLTNLGQASEKANVLEMLGKTVTYVVDKEGNTATGVVNNVDVSGDSPRMTVGEVPGIDPSRVVSVG